MTRHTRSKDELPATERANRIDKRAGTFRKLARVFFRDERGAAMVEFAIVAGLVFLPMLFGILEFGRLMFAKETVTAAAREGTRKAIVSGSASGTTDAQFTARIDSVVNARAQLDPLVITRTWTGSRDPGDTVTVTVAYTFTPVIPLPFLSSKTVQGISQQVIVF